MNIHAVFNGTGGTFRTMDMSAYCRRAHGVFADHGHAFSCDVVDGPALLPTLERAAARDDIDALIVGGGDGTVSAAAGLLWRQGVPLGIVPAGTMNLFARSLHLPLDVEAALAVLARAEAATVDIATANGHPFVHQFSVGLHPRLLRFRNAYAFASRLGKIRASVRAAIGVVLDPPRFRAVYEIDGERHEGKVSAISVSNNVFGETPLPFAARVDGGVLGVYVSRALTPPQVARLIVDILARRRRLNQTLKERTAGHVHLSFPALRHNARCVIDGEMLPLERDVAIDIHAGGLTVLRPKPADEVISGELGT